MPTKKKRKKPLMMLEFCDVMSNALRGKRDPKNREALEERNGAKAADGQLHFWINSAASGSSTAHHNRSL